MTDKKTAPLNIHQRILAVMADCAYVQKESKKVNNQYTFVAHDAVTRLLHPLCVKHGIVVIPTVVGHSQDGNRSEVDLNVAFINTDDPADRIDVVSYGYGIDQQDKGPGKAITYALKILELKLFMLESGDDVERDNIDHEPKDGIEAGGPLGKTELKKALQGFCDDLAACDNLDTLEGLVEGSQAVLEQIKRDRPSWWSGKRGSDIPGISQRIYDARAKFDKAPGWPGPNEDDFDEAAVANAGMVTGD